MTNKQYNIYELLTWKLVFLEKLLFRQTPAKKMYRPRRKQLGNFVHLATNRRLTEVEDVVSSSEGSHQQKKNEEQHR